MRTSINNLIAITGTRGKSTTVRFLTFFFQKSGYRTLGKITGTKASMIYPDGSFHSIKRKGNTSIIEQKRCLLKTAFKLRPEILITEIMSVTPEYQKMETRNILSPDYLVITNVKEDHMGVSGNSKEEIAKMFVKSAPKKTLCCTIESERNNFQTIENTITFIPENETLKKLPELQPGFYETLLIANYFVEKFDLDQSVFMDCINEFKKDDDVFYIKKKDENTLFVNAFSANDPESTLKIIEDLKKDFPQFKIRGVFCTRKDKPNRTNQWIKTFKENEELFDDLLVFGSHYSIIKRQRLPFKNKKITKEDFEQVFTPSNEKNIFIGFGNYVKSGEIILDYWNEVSK
jgi:poly-gamma-glutamate synthase PgsB/CapB